MRNEREPRKGSRRQEPMMSDYRCDDFSPERHRFDRVVLDPPLRQLPAFRRQAGLRELPIAPKIALACDFLCVTREPAVQPRW